MKKTLIVTTAALFASTALPSFAQDASATTSTDTNTSIETPAGDVNASTSGNMNAGTSDTGASAGASGTSSMSTSGSTSTSGGSMSASGSTGTAGSSMSADEANMSDTSYEAAVIGIETSAQVEFEPVDAEDIMIVRLSELEGDAETGNVNIDAALDANAEAMSALHTSVSQNETIVSSLEAEGDFTAEDVVAVRTNADGMLVVYVDDREDS